MPWSPPSRKVPVAPEDLNVQESIGADYLDDEVLEDFIQALASDQGFNAVMSVIDSLISTIERQEIMIWSLAKLLEEKGIITREELLTKISELNKKRYKGDQCED